MSFSTVKSASGADHYFMESDNYYLKSDEYIDRFQWWGKGAQLLGLENQISREDFLNPLQGKLPNGTEMPHSVNGTRRPGFDITFSAPKSVSILALVFNKQELIEAHQKAVDLVLAEIEKDAAQARVKGENGIEFERTNNLTVAKFLHDTSRDLDPQLHTHSVVMNLTQRSDGEWRALASNTREIEVDGQINGFFESIYHRQIYYSTIYRSELAKNLTELGYEIELLSEHEGKHGMFEIKGFPSDLKANFSKRREQIEKLIEEMAAKHARSSAKTTDFITLTSRKNKESIDREVLHGLWKKELEAKFSNFNPDSLKNTNIEKENISLLAREAVIDAIRHFTETRLIFNNSDLVTKSLQYTMGKASFSDINSAVQQLRVDKILISLGENEMTTKEILSLEQSLIDAVRRNSGRGFTTEVKETILDKMESSEHQKVIVRDLLESKDGISIVNMSIYEHPERFIETLLNTAEQGGKRVKILTPTKTHSNDLQKSVQRRTFNAWQWAMNFFNKPDIAQTIRGYLYHNQENDQFANLNAKGRDFLIIDAAQKIGYQDFEGLLTVAEAKNAKLIFLNSDDALKGYAAGNPIELMRKAKIQEYNLKDNNLPLHSLNTAVLDIKDDQERAERIASKYAMLSETAQKDTHVLAHSQKQADLLNHEIREALKNKGDLSHSEITIRTLNPIFLSNIDKKYATQYQNDMILRRFNNGKAEQYLVLKHIKDDNVVVLLNDKSEKIHWNPQKDKWQAALFKQEQIDIAVGEHLIATDNMEHLGITSGHRLKINAIQSNKVVFINDNTGEVLDIEKKLLHDSKLKYAYATTISRAEREMRSNVIVDIKGFASNQAVMNEIKRRATNSIDILTDNLEKLKIQAEKEQLKLTTTDTLITKQDEVPELQKFIDSGTIKHFEKDLDQIAILLCDKFGGIDHRTVVQESLDYVLSKLSEREAAFQHNNLVTEALNFAIKQNALAGKNEPITLDSVRKELELYKQEGRLNLSAQKTYWVTKESLECEREIVKISKEGVGQVRNLFTKDGVFEKLEKTSLTEGQKNAAHLILTTKDRFIIIQGDPGTGKTSMIQEVKNMLMGQDFKIQGIAPTHQAVKELEGVGIPSQTLKAFITAHIDLEGKEVPDYSKTLFILDEYSMVSNQDALEFKNLIKSYNGRVAQIGDIKQFEAVPAGRPMYVEIKAGIKMVQMQELVRQRNEDALGIAKAAISGDVDGIFKATEKMNASQYIERDKDRMTMQELMTIENSIHEVEEGSLGALAKACAREYVLRIPEVREKTPIIVQTHQNRKEIEILIREELKKTGELPIEGGMELNRLVRLDVHKADIKQANLKNVSHIRLGNNYLEVIEVDQKNKALLLKTEDGKIQAFDTKRDLAKFKENIEVFKLEKNEIMPNDLITLRKNDLDRGHRANNNYVVVAIEGKTIQLKHQQDGSKVSLNTDLLKDSHWDYAYTKTGYSIQGGSAAFPIIYLPSSDEKLAHVRSACIAFTRQRHHCMIFTDNRKEVIKKFSRASDKLSAMAVMGELEDPASPAGKGDKGKTKPIKIPAIIEKFDSKDLEFRLNDQAEFVVEHLLGKPNQKLSTPYNWRYGKKGSMSVRLDGDHRGKWHNFESGESGNLFSLIKNELRMSDFKEVLIYAANLVGNKIEVQPQQKVKKQETKVIKSNQWGDKLVARIFREAVPLNGTLGEKYLKEHRNLLDIRTVSVKFHPSVYSHTEEEDGKAKYVHFPALVSFALDKNGNATGMQAIYLDNDGNKKAGLTVSKKSFAHIGGSHIVINEGKGDDKVSFIAEGVETAMSIREVAPSHNVIATLSKGNFKNVDPTRLAQIVFLCLDNDGINTLIEGKVVKAAIEKLHEANKQVFIAMPRKEGTDFNDSLKQGGKGAVREDLSKYLPAGKFVEKIDKIIEIKKDIDKTLDESIQKEILNKVGRKELDKIMLAINQVNPSKTIGKSPQKQISIEKIKQIHDREI